MTISTELRKAGPFTGNGVTTAFPFFFKVFAASDVTVVMANTQGNESVLALGADYTVALNADQDAAPGGTVTLAAPLAIGHRLAVTSVVPNLQPTDITNNGGFYPRVIEDALDRHVAQIQQIDEKVDRALKVAITSPLGDKALPSPVAGMLIGWNESNDGLKNYAPIGGTLLGQQVAAAYGSSLVGFQQAGTGAVVRTAQDKLREFVSVMDFGAVGDGVADDTAAFIAAGKGAYVPAGEFSVDLSLVRAGDYRGPGVLCYQGQRVSVESPLVSGTVVQRLVCEPFFGFNNGTVDTQIYANAQFATQGIAWADVAGVEKLYVSQRTSGNTWKANERGRIVEFNFDHGGAVLNHVAFSPELALGHMGDLSARVDGSTVYLYAPLRVSGDSDANGGGKGVSRIHWKGTDTIQSDVVGYQLFGNAGSSHQYSSFQNAVPAVSTDGRFIVLVATRATGTGRFLFVYDRAEVEAATDPLAVRPIVGPVSIQKGGGEYAETLQGIACDGRHIYILWGFTPVRAVRCVSVYDFSGNRLRVIPFDGPAAQYSEQQLNGETELKFPASAEPEGCALRNGELLTMHVDFFRDTPSIVTFDGANYACILANTGVVPTDRTAWIRTTVAATAGAWNETTAYTVGESTRRTKKIYALGLASGAAGEQPTQCGVVDATSGTGQLGIGYPDYAFGRGTAYQCSQYEESTGKYYASFAYSEDQIRIYDSTVGAVNEKYLSLRYTDNATNVVAQLLSEGNSTASGAFAALYGNSSASAPGEARLSSGGTATLRLQNGGLTWFSCGTGSLGDVNLTFKNFAPNADSTASGVGNTLGLPTRRWDAVYARTATISTSDIREKEDIRPLSEAERAVATKIKGMLKAFRYKNRGESARIHFGVTAQDVMSAFQSEGLDPANYGLFCYDEWDDIYEVDDDGNSFLATPAGNRYGIRYEELLAFIIGTL